MSATWRASAAEISAARSRYRFGRVNLTERQEQVFAFIVAAEGRAGLPPTVREIAAALGIASPNGVAGHIQALIKKGVLKPRRGRGPLEIAET